MSKPVLSGVLAALAAAVLGALWQLLTRHGVTTTLAPMELALLRYGIPALVLLPVALRTGLRPAGLSWPQLALLAAGGGLPFGLLVLAGAQFAPVAHMGVFMAGTMPVFTALGCWMLLGERIGPVRWLGFALIAGGVGWIGLAALGTGASSWRGDLLFVLAAVAWAGHTLAFRLSGLAPWQGVAIVNAWSLLAAVLLLPWQGASRLFTAPWQDVALQALGQGVLAGLLGLGAYLAAVERLGSARAALSSALVPVLTTLGGVGLLGEAASAGTWAAVALVAAGVAVAASATVTTTGR